METAPILKICSSNKFVAELYSMGMEDETRAFLIKIVNTIAVILLWMMLNVFFGVYKQLGFFENKPGWQNWLYYTLAVASLVWVILYIRRKWKF
jgi:hypothetical protein